MGSLISKARWLEPVGQTFAVLAFSVQFFVVDPASADLMRAYFNWEHDSLSRIEGLVSGPQKKTLTETLLRPVREQLEELPVVIADERKRRWRPWLFALFAIGGALTIAGKAASVRCSTR
ncbi:hypothetical protein [Methylocapsa acidiphila]|uniref:hypothetical protein n=1 Tax=Methylocapsa acidiphila TaxID=133552 RepID=UPI0004219870|nr:hypothetical protein [Methylocapsa acidiphila]